MALFGSGYDMSFFRLINRELINSVIDTPILYYSVNLDSTTTNIYGETQTHIYNRPIKLHCLFNINDEMWVTHDGINDNAQQATFRFLKDDLDEKGIIINPGDVIEIRRKFFEIERADNNQKFMGKDPHTWFNDDQTGNPQNFGWDVSIICAAHLIKVSHLDIVDVDNIGNITNADNSIPYQNYKN